MSNISNLEYLWKATGVDEKKSLYFRSYVSAAKHEPLADKAVGGAVEPVKRDIIIEKN